MAKNEKKNVDRNSLNPAAENLTKMLKQATKNLYYISETDAEILPFIGQPAAAVTKEEILRQTGKTLDEKIEERDFERIFERLTKIQDWFGEEEKTLAKKFENLKNLLSENLKDLKVFKIGEIELEIYFVGLDEVNRLTGIQTKAVET